MPFIAIAVLVALAVGGSVTVAAENAQPGDMLYEYKTHINDNVRDEYHAVKAMLDLEASSETQVEVGSKSEAEANLDSETESETTVNADGSLEAEVDLGVEATLR